VRFHAGARMKHRSRKQSEQGNAIIEVSLMLPWILFLFVGVLDFGFYSYAAICTQNAARVAALASAYSSSAASDTSQACSIVLQEMNSLPNAQTLTSCSSGACPSSAGLVNGAQPISVTACPVSGPDGASAASITVTYLSIPLIPIPGVVRGQLTITRTAEAPVLNTTPVS
jgi:Flp pilus assembly protein TadG